MTKQVWKYSLGESFRAELYMPAGAEILHCALQASSGTMLWALVDPLQPNERRAFRVYGTGHPIDAAVKHVGTYLDGNFVWHVFEVVDVQGGLGDPKETK